MFGIGFFANGVRAAAGGSYELIETITVGSGGAASVTFSNLNTYSTTYQHLQVRWTLRGTQSTPSSHAVRFNGDTGTNYAWHSLVGFGTGIASEAGSSANRIRILGGIPGTLQNANGYEGGVMDVLDAYETTKNTTIRAFHGTSVDNVTNIRLSSGSWFNTSSLTSITFVHDNGNFVQGSRFSIYGLKAS